MEHGEIRKQLTQRRNELLGRLHALKKDLHREQGPLPADFAEQVIELENLDVLFELDEVSRHELNRINNALTRLDGNQYDYCVICGKAIGEARLKALPTADTCMSCAQAIARE